MSSLGIASTVFNLLSSIGGSGSAASSSSRSSISASATGGDFSSSLALQMAAMKAGSAGSFNAVETLTGLSNRNGNANDFLSALGASDPLSLTGLQSKKNNLDALGRNLSLFDPESAYRMMTDINNRDVTYKAQFAELTDMGGAVSAMQQAGRQLLSSVANADDATIKSALQSFATKYNEWVGRYDGDVGRGGLLEGTQAAEVALYELRQSIDNGFNGAMNGIHGLRDLGFSVDPTTHVASVDTQKLDAVLAHNREGALAAINEFGQNFAKSAELLVSANNFIPNRLANLDRVIDYIGDNKRSLQAEFGLGDAARPSAVVARALAAYNAMFKA